MLMVEPIGIVKNRWKDPDPLKTDEMMSETSLIEVSEKFADGLLKIENYRELYIIWQFHRSSGYELQTTTRSGDFRGVFACCSPRRPNAIGLTVVELLHVEQNILTVKGLDAINGTPVLDIKPVTGSKKRKEA